MTDLKELLERVKAAKGPDRHLSRDLSRHFELLGHPTASVDDALALVEHKLPGWFWRCGHSTEWEGWAHIYREHPNNTQPGDGEFSAQAKTPPLAILSALLTALIVGAKP